MRRILFGMISLAMLSMLVFMLSVLASAQAPSDVVLQLNHTHPQLIELQGASFVVFDFPAFISIPIKGGHYSSDATPVWELRNFLKQDISIPISVHNNTTEVST